MLLRRLALTVALVAPLAVPMVASAGSISDNTNLNASQTVAGVGNFGQQDISGIGNGGLFYGKGPGSIHKNTNVNIDQTVAGEFNTGLQSLHGVANGGTFKLAPAHRPVLLRPY
jgi:hypothetical protein